MSAEKIPVADYALKALIALAMAASSFVLADLRDGVSDLRREAAKAQLSTVERLTRIETQVSASAAAAADSDREIREIKAGLHALDSRLTVLEHRSRR